MQTLQERLKLAMAGPPKVTQAALARACRVKAPSVNDWLSGKTKSIEGENLLNAASFLRVSPLWLATGRGPMREPGQAKSEPEPSADSSDDEYIHVPLKSAKGAMGRGYENPHVEVKGHLAFKRSWVRTRGLNEKYLEAFYAEGDSMYPTINSGDVVLLNKAQKNPIHNNIFALNGAEGVIIKRLSYSGAVNQWGLVSDNLDKRKFPDQWLEEDDEPMSLMGQIVWRGGDL